MNRRLALLAVTATLGLAWLYWPYIDPNPQLYPLIKYEDGSTEYRLVNDGADRIEGTSDDQHWVLRIPSGLWVESPDEGRSEDQMRENPEYPYNLSFSIMAGLPDLEFVEDPFAGSLQDIVRLRINAPEITFGEGKFVGQGVSAFSAFHDVLANYNCRRDFAVGPGVFWLRQPTAQEVNDMGKLYGVDPRNGQSQYFFPPECNLRTDAQTFAVYDEALKPIGYGDCRLRSAEANFLGETDQCSFWFWIPWERKIQVQLSGEFVPQLQFIYGDLLELLTDATDVEKSINMLTSPSNR